MEPDRVKPIFPFRGRKPELIGVEQRHSPREHRGSDVNGIGELPAGDRKAKVLRPRIQEQVHQVQRIRVGEPLQFVEREYARRPISSDRADENLDAVADRGVVVEGFLQAAENVQSGFLEGKGEIRSDDLRRVLDVQRQPGGEHPGFLKAPATFGKERCLAKSPRRLQHRRANRGREDPIHQLQTMEVAGLPLRDRDFLLPEPGQCGASGIAWARFLPSRWGGKIGWDGFRLSLIFLGQELHSSIKHHPPHRLVRAGRVRRREATAVRHMIGKV